MKVEGSDVRFIFVWMPVLPTDKQERAVEHGKRETDRRAEHFWDDGLVLARQLAGPLESKKALGEYEGQIAWDVVMLYPRGVTWTDELPMPKSHAFPGTFNADAFKAEVAAELGR